MAKTVRCDGCGGDFPAHKHLCFECMARAAPGLGGKLFWWVFKRLVQAGAACPNCKTPFFLSKPLGRDRKSTRLNSSHQLISYAVFSLKKKKTVAHPPPPPSGRISVHLLVHTIISP